MKESNGKLGVTSLTSVTVMITCRSEAMYPYGRETILYTYLCIASSTSVPLSIHCLYCQNVLCNNFPIKSSSCHQSTRSGAQLKIISRTSYNSIGNDILCLRIISINLMLCGEYLYLNWQCCDQRRAHTTRSTVPGFAFSGTDFVYSVSVNMGANSLMSSTFTLTW